MKIIVQQSDGTLNDFTRWRYTVIGVFKGWTVWRASCKAIGKSPNKATYLAWLETVRYVDWTVTDAWRAAQMMQ